MGDVIDPNPTIAVLLPCYNEEAAIAQTIAGFRAALPDATIYVYDNNRATAPSRSRARRARSSGAERIQGKGAVVRRMFADVDADIYVMADGDATYDAASAPALVARMLDEQLDMVVGCRVREAAAAYRRGHRFGNALLTGHARQAVRAQLHRHLQGYRVFSRRFVKSFPVLSVGFEIETEISVHALELKMPVAEIETPLFRAAGGVGVEAQHLSRRLAHPAARSRRCTGSSGRCGSSVRSVRAAARRGGPRDPAGDHLCADRARAALPDRDPGDRADDPRGARPSSPG